ncbi:stalk domain-containing protein [Paenibacillus sp. Soil522]|uniref:stalk domain-containing protein n=1 Tax=Paenibacillus sp. Soil522 TaxID=1736388 RepID=UPI001F349CDE|nr:stalk domain-containing protein [Paenibacillus sp. Soil522]
MSHTILHKFWSSNPVVVRGKVVDSKQIDGVTYVAARAYGEALGATVTWDVKTNITTVE